MRMQVNGNNITTVSLETVQTTYEIKDDRFYLIDGKHYPRITWILSAYPKDEIFYKWLRDNGSAAEDIKDAAAESGKRIHEAAHALSMGITVKRESLYNDAEWEKVLDFVSWYNTYKPDKIVATESLVYSATHGYAGTFDLMVEKDGKTYLLDLKTGKGVHNSFYLQLAAYKRAFEELTGRHVDGVGIIHVGTKHKCGYNFILVTDESEMNKHFDLFLAVKSIFHNEYGPVPTPQDKVLPLTVKLEINK